MSTPKGWTSYTGGIYSIDIPKRDSSTARSNFLQTSLQDFLEAANLHRADQKDEDGDRARKTKRSSRLVDR